MKRTGERTIIFENKPTILSYGSVVGKKEHEGPLSNEFDAYTIDSFFGIFLSRNAASSAMPPLMTSVAGA